MYHTGCSGILIFSFTLPFYESSFYGADKRKLFLYKTCNENFNLSLDTKSINISIEAGLFNLDRNLRQEFSLTRHVELLNQLEL